MLSRIVNLHQTHRYDFMNFMQKTAWSSLIYNDYCFNFLSIILKSKDKSLLEPFNLYMMFIIGTYNKYASGGGETSIEENHTFHLQFYGGECRTKSPPPMFLNDKP